MKKSTKSTKFTKSTTGIALFFLFVVVIVVGYFAYLSGRSRDLETDAVMTAVQNVLSRNLQNNYPPTVKEVVKYYTEIQRCCYTEGCKEEEIEQLGRKARELYDADLLSINEENVNLQQLKADIAEFQKQGRQMIAVSVASSANVDTFTEDGYEFARIYCMYTVLENGQSNLVNMVYLLRRDENRRWKIYGWDLAQNVNPGE